MQTITGPEAFRTAERKARYGRRDWIIWRGRDGVKRAATVTAESMKAALLAIGTQGECTMIAGSSCVGHRVTWRLGIVFLGNLKAGHWY